MAMEHPPISLDRRAIGEALGRLAFAAELTEHPTLNASGLSAAVWTLRSIEGDIVELAKSGELAKRRDLVKDAVRAITEIVETGHCAELDRLELEIPPGLFDVRRVKGLGPKKVRALWKDLGVTSVGELEYACTENRLVELKGFGKKTQENVRTAIAEVRMNEGRHRLDRAIALAAGSIEKLLHASLPAHLAGDARRAQEIVDDIVVVTAGDARSAALPFAQHVDSEGEDEGAREWTSRRDGMVRVIRAPTSEALATTLLFATGSDAHTALLVERASALGLTLTERGLMRGDAQLETPDEDAIYHALGLHPTAPERREAGVPLVEIGRERPRLITERDLVGALHNHTTASDGTATLVEMRTVAAARGLAYLGITEHSETAAYAGGLSRERIAHQRDEIARLNAERDAGCVLMSGIESDILKEGALDYDDATLDALEVVVASVHQRYGLDGAQMTARLIRAAAYPSTDIIGHPTGRLLLGRKPVDIDMDAFLNACARSRTVVELNANPARLDLSDVHLARAKELGVLVSIAADAHSPDALEHLRFGILVARRAGLTKDDVLNARGLDEVKTELALRRAHRRSLAN
jgi:DNA polymerase (family 10)